MCTLRAASRRGSLSTPVQHFFLYYSVWLPLPGNRAPCRPTAVTTRVTHPPSPDEARVHLSKVRKTNVEELPPPYRSSENPIRSSVLYERPLKPKKKKIFLFVKLQVSLPKFGASVPTTHLPTESCFQFKTRPSMKLHCLVWAVATPALSTTIHRTNF